MINWWRSWHGAPMDHKWSVIAAKTGVKAGIVSAIVWELLDYASQNKERGSIENFDVETYAVYSGFSEDEIISVIQAITEKKIIVDGKFAKWGERQRKDEEEIERVRKYRNEKKKEIENNYPGKDEIDTDDYELLRNVTKNYIDTDKDKDKEKELKDNASGKKPEAQMEKPKEPKPKLEPSDPKYWNHFGKHKELAMIFSKAINVVPIGSDFSKWNKGFNDLVEAGITAEDVPKIVERMRGDGLTIGAPQSILKVGRDMKARGLLKELKHEPEFEYFSVDGKLYGKPVTNGH